VHQSLFFAHKLKCNGMMLPYNINRSVSDIQWATLK